MEAIIIAVTKSQLCDVQGREPEMGSEAVKKLLAAVDSYLPQPVRELDKPFYLPIEQVFSIAGKCSSLWTADQRSVL